MDDRRKKLAVAAVLLAGILGGAWSLLGGGEPESEEARVARMLDECEAAFESGDVDEVVRHLHPEYSDNEGRNRDGAHNMLKLLLVLQKKRYSVDRREEAIRVEGDDATATFVATGSERRGDEVLPSGLGTWDIRAELRRTGGEWQILRMELKRKR